MRKKRICLVKLWINMEETGLKFRNLWVLEQHNNVFSGAKTGKEKKGSPKQRSEKDKKMSAEANLLRDNQQTFIFHPLSD